MIRINKEVPQQSGPAIGWRNGGLFAIATLCTALLLFQIQPLLGKVLLPSFGGAPAVWITCLFFFQAALLGGYLYAHLSVTYVAPRTQWLIHILLLVLTCLTLPLVTDRPGMNLDIQRPAFQILWILSLRVGLPFVLLSATSPLLQTWWQNRFHTTPFHLYAASNVGSFVGLWIYPLWIEPRWPLAVQGQAWSWGFLGCGVLLFALGSYVWKVPSISDTPSDGQRDSSARRASNLDWSTLESLRNSLWVAYSMCGSMMLLATTNLLCQDIASVPFLWILPLSLYLITFIGCFLSERLYHRSLGLVAWFLSSLIVVWMLTAGLRVYRQLGVQVLGLLFVLTTVCWICHGELFRLRPQGRRLTLYYLAISCGGVLGSAGVTFLAPRLFSGYYEFYLTLLASLLLVVFTWRIETVSAEKPEGRRRYAQRLAGLLTLTIGLIAALWFGIEALEDSPPQASSSRLTVAAARNFYGVLRVVRNDLQEPNRARVSLLHGSTTHGFQFLQGSKREQPTAYFGRSSGIGIVIEALQKQRRQTPNRWGVIGLGTGTLAAYARAGDVVRFYEINPLVVQYAEEHFSFLKDARSRGVDIEMVLGDARAAMQQEWQSGQPQRFDLIVMDAFSGDAIPMHLLTREAMQLYWNHGKSDATVAVQVTNRHARLTPVVRTLAAEFETPVVRISHVPRSPDDPDAILGASRWMVLSRDRDLLREPSISFRVDAWDEDDDRQILWTDDYSSLLPLLDWSDEVIQATHPLDPKKRHRSESGGPR
uniref:Integral membrane protein-like protein n=1 Tax=uncultured bacterium A1Q1_fos_962 TaxID=1256592 RepID=L7VYL8_9BACT|nr:integral membrane protein-like protein [uncultured bacterium A1Q1_fos_962]